jgi:hypothetical protein
MKLRRRGASVVAACVFAAGLSAVRWEAGRAQQTDTVRTRAFVAGGVYDRPYLTRLLGRTALGGYAEVHARYERADGVVEKAGFEARRFNLFSATQVSDYVRIGAELEFEEGGREVRLEYAAIDLAVHPSLTLRGGMLLSPLGRFNLAHDSPLNEFTDRPLVSTQLIGVALSEPGFGLLGQIPLAGRGRITFEAYAVNGFHAGVIEADPAGTRVAAGRANFDDENASPAWVGRLAWSPDVAFEVGVSAHHGAWNVFRREGVAVDRRRDLTIGAIDLEAEVLGIRLSGEAARARIELPDALAGIRASRQEGFNVDLTRDLGRGLVPTMPVSTFTVKLRLEAVDFDAGHPGDSVRRLGAGLNFRPARDTVLKLDYVAGRARDRFDNPSATAAILFSIATYF